MLTNTSKTVVSRAENLAFDRKVATTSIGEYNLGFPGQYYDAEGASWQNWFRTYDGSVGRYTQSDPIGLAGGLNTYAYVGGNPAQFIDPTGEYAILVPVGFGVVVGGTSALIAALNDPCSTPGSIALATAAGMVVGGASGNLSVGGTVVSNIVRNGLAGATGNAIGQLLGSREFSGAQVLVQSMVGAVGGNWGRAAGFTHGLRMLRSGATADQAISTSLAVGSVHAVGANGLQQMTLPSNFGGIRSTETSVACGCGK